MENKTFCILAISNEESYTSFYNAWKKELSTVELIVVEDSSEISFKINDQGVHHYSLAEVEADLGVNKFIIPSGTPALNSYGAWKAYEKGAEFLVIVDEFCRPEREPFFATHVKALMRNSDQHAWFSTLNNVKAKGAPFYNTKRSMPLMLNHGMWTENAVLDAASELAIKENSDEISFNEGDIPRGHYFSMSSINLSFRREMTPLMYFLLMGEEFPFQDYGDIWCGLISKKIMDHLNWACRSGTPYVQNLREKNIWHRMRDEAVTLPLNESFWLKLDEIILCSNTVDGCYKQIIDTVETWGHPYFKTLAEAMKVWHGLFFEPKRLKEEPKSKSNEPQSILSYLAKKEKLEYGSKSEVQTSDEKLLPENDEQLDLSEVTLRTELLDAGIPQGEELGADEGQAAGLFEESNDVDDRPFTKHVDDEPFTKHEHIQSSQAATLLSDDLDDPGDAFVPK
ncbi:MAG: hypothetical protein HRT88_03350 [Lentisphaeraceae bacterium]|nr:hypothetical protein [Lentisphaeraceae bacterium]